MAKNNKPQSEVATFQSISQADLPQGRNGKHKTIILQILNDLERLGPGQALKIPLSQLPDTKENIRSALNRATRQRGLEVVTSSDEQHLYAWTPDPAEKQ
jgi:hypothetical protein